MNTDGRSSMAIIPIVIMEAVYITRLSSSATALTAAGTPSAIMKNALAGWPPVADGVMAEK